MSSPTMSGNPSQFTLRALLGAVALIAIALGVMRYGGWTTTLFVLTFGSLIVAHILGNSLGTRLRDEVSPQLNPKSVEPKPPIALVRSIDRDQRLHQRTPLGRMIFVTSGGSAAIGAILGGLALASWTSAGLAGWLVGTLSSAVLGAFFGFLLASFLEMTIRAWWQAAKQR